MIFKAIEVRSLNSLVAAQVIVEEGENPDEVFTKASQWCQEKAQALLPEPTVQLSPEELRKQVEQEVRQSLADELLGPFTNKKGEVSPLAEAVLGSPGEIYTENKEGQFGNGDVSVEQVTNE